MPIKHWPIFAWVLGSCAIIAAACFLPVRPEVYAILTAASAVVWVSMLISAWGKRWMILPWILGFLTGVFVGPIGLAALTVYYVLVVSLGIWMLVVLLGRLNGWLSTVWFVGFIGVNMYLHWQQVKQGHILPGEQVLIEGVSNSYLLGWVFVRAVSQLSAPLTIILSIVVISIIVGVHALIDGLTKRNAAIG